MSNSVTVSPAASLCSNSAKKPHNAAPSCRMVSRMCSISAADLMDLNKVDGLMLSIKATSGGSCCTVLTAVLAGSSNNVPCRWAKAGATLA